MKKRKPAQRPGGRSERVKAAVFDAVEALMAKKPGEIPPMSAVAARAGINPTSLYRRWSDASVLATDVAVESIMRDNPIADTGTLRGDLLAWATSVGRSLSNRKNVTLLRVLAATTQMDDRHYPQRLAAIARRGQDILIVLERAQVRGESVPTLPEVLEIVLAPIYYRVLFLGPMGETEDVSRLVDRVLAMAPRKSSRK